MVRRLMLVAVACGACGPKVPTRSDACLDEARRNPKPVASDPDALRRQLSPDEPTEPEIAAPGAIDGKRISGDTNVVPDQATRVEMRRIGVVATTASFKLCLGTDGAPISATRLSSSCFPRYDETIRTRMLTWRYSPYTLDGVPKAVCTQINYVLNNGRRT